MPYMEISEMDILACKTTSTVTKVPPVHDTTQELLTLEVVGSNKGIFVQKEKIAINSEIYNECYRIDKLQDGESSEHSQQINLDDSFKDTDQLLATSVYNQGSDGFFTERSIDTCEVSYKQNKS